MKKSFFVWFCATLLMVIAPRAIAQFTFIPRGAPDWRYLDNGTDQGTAWSAAVFDDLSWASGTAQFGYGDGDEVTVISFGADAGNKYVTTYFRKYFWVTNAAQWSNLTLRVMRDDGAVVYLNGTEVNRQNMPAGPVSYQTLALTAVNPPDESNFFEQLIPTELLVSGQNTIAVEVHQNNPASSDISFDLELVATSTAPTRPTIVTQPQSQTVPEGSDVTFSVTATGTPPLGYRWRRNSITIPGATNSTLTLFSVTASNAGNYSVIVSNFVGSVLSSNAVLTVTPPNTNLAPVVTWVRPTNGAIFPAGSTIFLVAQASDPDGTISFVEFFANSTRLGQVISNTNTYSFVWSNAPAGTFQLHAEAVDNAGGRGISDSAQVTITGPNTNTGFLFIPRGASGWRYLDNGTDQGIAWSDPFFDDSAWASGTAEFGYGDADEATVVSFGPDSFNKYVTTYFRKQFWVTNASEWANLTLRLVRDDGAVVYLNGTEINRQNMPAGPVSYQTLATVAINTPDESTFFEESVSPSLLVNGQNTIAVEIHQVNVSSSDISFNLELAGSTTAPTPPTIVTHPQSQTVPDNATVTFSVTATGTEPLRYRWRKNAVTVPNQTNSTLTLFNVTAADAGTYSVIVTNSFGSALSSNAVLTVTPSTNNMVPVVIWIRPTNGATFAVGAPILMTARATDSDGTVNFVEFFANSTLLAQVTSNTNLYNFTWSNAPPGTFQLRAEAVDNVGGRGISASVQITVTSPPTNTGFIFIPRGAAGWRYLDNGSDQGIAWSDPFFDDSTWASGTAQLGYGDGDEATVVGFGSDPLNKYITTYFRKQFWVTNAAQWSNLTLRLLRDDGAVVYLNGTEVNRQNMPPDPINYQTLAPAAVNPPDESTFFEASVSPTLLISGQNTIAVEIHQVNVNSSDISFDLELVGTPATPTPPTIVTHPQSQTVTNGSDVTFTVVATGSQPLTYRWRRNGLTLFGATNSTLTLFSVTSSNAGTYSVVVQNSAGIRLSSNAVLTVVSPSNMPPVVTLTSPTNGQTFRARQPIILRAQANDPDGTVSFVDFFSNTTRVARAFSSTGTFTSIWSNAPSGNHLIRAVATDNQGAQASSATASIIVLTNRPPTALDQSVAVQEDSSAPITLGGTDPDGNFLTFTVLTLPAHGTLTGSGRFLTYTPDPNYFGPDSFTFRVRDQEFESAPATVQITVTPVNDTPVARINVENAVTFLDQRTIITLDESSATVILDGSQSSDLENDPLTYTWLVGDPPAAFAAGVHVVAEFPTGSYVFQLQVSDGDLSGTENASVDVRTPCDAIALLILRIEESSHPNGTKRPLIDSLEMSCDAFDKGKLDKGIEELEAFQDKVAIRLGDIDPAFAELLINAAQTLIDAIPPE